MHRLKYSTAALLALAALAAPAAAATIRIDAGKPGHAVSPLLWGIFFEDIDLSADGGVYPELVRNRSFEDSAKPKYWSAVGKAELAVVSPSPQNPPINAKNPHSLRVHVLEANGGVANEGYWGVAVKQGETYRLSLFARGEGTLTASVESADGRTTYASKLFDPLSEDWTTFPAVIKANGTDAKARLVIRSSDPGTFWLDMVSLLPEKTWKGHGLRPDLCEMLAGLKPSFMRFPGGCWVEGDTMATSYRWKATIGDVEDRRQVWNLWDYQATNGLGFHEYLQLAEDLGATPLFCINIGMSHHEVVPMNKMGEYVQDALDAIEYANGPVDSKWGALRAKAGHPAPFHLKYMEIGNENGGPPYFERWPLFYHAIKAKHPEVQLVANLWGKFPADAQPDIVDEHYYDTPAFFIREAAKYDPYDRKTSKVFVGEYAVTQNCGMGNLRGALGEAAFMTGLERNSDVAIMASYAPLLVNVNHRHWSPDLINFDGSRCYGLPSYYVQQMFSQNRGDVVLPTDVAAPEVSPAEHKGGIGVGTWSTQAEFKDIRVTQGDKELLSADLSNGLKGWRLRGGKWQVKDGALQQTGDGQNICAFIGDPHWTDYTLTLKARKLGGDEGFLICFHNNNGSDDAKGWWNIGGWGNGRHCLEMHDVPDASVPGRIETGKWYDIRIELQGNRIKCFLDGKLIHDVTVKVQKMLHASATRAGSDVIVKVVNVSDEPQETAVELHGIDRLGSEATAIVLTSATPDDENSLEQPRKVVPATSTVPIAGPNFRHTFPAHSLTILRIPAAK